MPGGSRFVAELVARTPMRHGDTEAWGLQKEQGADDQGVTGGCDLSTKNKKGAGGPKGPEKWPEKSADERAVVPRCHRGPRARSGARSLSQGVCCAASPQAHRGTQKHARHFPGSSRLYQLELCGKVATPTKRL
ncbi:hypothetical protein NDU88_002685 [Pleurodeles waltl]|uniref:Uncharacterized protein n=1 Tax=Pleurodeles waltl TaxID=8319 RepID=A0AAV7NMN4_PLEWA|nr:hypothetical protein NDU88_002685 [Pleurodeles waltl]